MDKRYTKGCLYWLIVFIFIFLIIYFSVVTYDKDLLGLNTLVKSKSTVSKSSGLSNKNIKAPPISVPAFQTNIKFI